MTTKSQQSNHDSLTLYVWGVMSHSKGSSDKTDAAVKGVEADQKALEHKLDAQQAAIGDLHSKVSAARNP